MFQYPESSKHFSMLPHKRVDEKQTIKCYIFQIENKQHYFLSSVKHHSNVFCKFQLSNSSLIALVTVVPSFSFSLIRMLGNPSNIFHSIPDTMILHSFLFILTIQS